MFLQTNPAKLGLVLCCRIHEVAGVGWALEERRLRRRLARNVAARRRELGLSIEAAAHAAAMDERHWRKVEAGEHGSTLRTLAKISIALGVEARALLT
jgi:ribosome-binding protein aMBF1 (putative translation factor)